jgi:hypothetical protein
MFSVTIKSIVLSVILLNVVGSLIGLDCWGRLQSLLLNIILGLKDSKNCITYPAVKRFIVQTQNLLLFKQKLLTSLVPLINIDDVRDKFGNISCLFML